MLPRRHPETEVGGEHARESLFRLLVGTIFLALLINRLLHHVSSAQIYDWSWWVLLLFWVSAMFIVVLFNIRRDDRRIGQAKTEIELLLPYVLFGHGRVRLGQRKSYSVTSKARSAWTAAFPEGLLITGREGDFTRRILPEHLALVRYLLVFYLAEFGRLSRPKQVVHGWLRVGLPMEQVSWESLSPAVREVLLVAPANKARPQALWLPLRTTIEAYDKGPLLLRLRWYPVHRRWLHGLLKLTRWPPGGEVRVRWWGQLSEVPLNKKQYEHLTARLDNLSPGMEPHVVVTRMVVEVTTRWNVLEEVARFRDWALNLCLHWQREMDYRSWRDYYLERVVDDLDWKIGWMKKGETPSIADRLSEIEKRLAVLEAKCKPRSGST